MKKLCLVFLFSISALFGRDCATLAFTTLSDLANQPVSYETWEAELGTNKESPVLTKVISSWNRHFMVSPLRCIYSIIPNMPFDDVGIAFEQPYFWVGTVPAQMIDVNEPGVHSAIVIFSPDRVNLVHTLTKERYYFVEKLTYREFFLRTVAIYEIHSTAPIKWKTLDPTLFK